MTQIEIKQNNGNLINIKADKEDSGLFYDGLFKMLSMPVAGFQNDDNTVDVEKPEPNPVEAKKPEPEPVEVKKPEPKPVEVKKPEPVEAKKSEPKPVETKKAEPKPVETKKVEPKPVEVKKPEPRPVETKKAEPRPVEVKKPEPKPVEAKKQEPKPAEIKKPEPAEINEPNDTLPNIPENAGLYDQYVKDLHTETMTIEGFLNEIKNITYDVKFNAHDNYKKFENIMLSIMHNKYKTNSFRFIPKENYGKVLADLRMAADNELDKEKRSKYAAD